MTTMATINYSVRADRLTSRPTSRLFHQFQGLLQTMPGNRIAHVARAVKAYEFIGAGTFRPLWDTLPGDSAGGYFAADAAQRGTEANYARQLLQVQQRCARLKGPSVITLETGLVLHDIGTKRDQGWDHDKAGAPMVQEIFEQNPVPEADPARVATLVGLHGAIPNFGVDIFPEDLQQLDPVTRDQLFVLSCADAAARPGKGPQINENDRMNGLTPKTLETYELIADPANLSDKNWFTDFRLRHLLSPCVYSNLTDHELAELKAALNHGLGTDQEFFMTRVLFKLENRCFPVIRETAQGPNGELHFPELSQLFVHLNGRVKNLFAAQGEKRVTLFSFPDLFQFLPGTAERNSYLAALRTALSKGSLGTENLSVEMADNKYKMTLRLDRLG